MEIALISIDPSFGNCAGLYNALSIKHNVSCYFKQIDPKGFHELIPYKLGFNMPEYDHYVVVSSDAYVRLNTPKNKTTVILTDSYFLKNHKTIDLKGVRVLCMPDLAQYCDYDKLYYMPFQWDLPVVKHDVFTIAHSPYDETKMALKGTEIIESVGDIDVIMGLSWMESIQRKSRAHMFIDQISERESRYKGGIGKSGLEAMAVGCLTFTSGVPVEGEIPAPPVIWVDRYTLAHKLVKHISNGFEKKAKEQKLWADTYLNYNFQSNYLL